MTGPPVNFRVRRGVRTVDSLGVLRRLNWTDEALDSAVALGNIRARTSVRHRVFRPIHVLERSKSRTSESRSPKETFRFRNLTGALAAIPPAPTLMAARRGRAGRSASIVERQTRHLDRSWLFITRFLRQLSAGMCRVTLRRNLCLQRLNPALVAAVLARLKGSAMCSVDRTRRVVEPTIGPRGSLPSHGSGSS